MVLCQHWDNKVRLPPPTRSLSKHSPALNELHLLLGGRSSYSPTAAVVSQISSLKNLQHLTMDFVVSEVGLLLRSSTIKCIGLESLSPNPCTSKWYRWATSTVCSNAITA